jgi:hypothetical protein
MGCAWGRRAGVCAGRARAQGGGVRAEGGTAERWGVWKLGEGRLNGGGMMSRREGRNAGSLPGENKV